MSTMSSSRQVARWAAPAAVVCLALASPVAAQTEGTFERSLTVSGAVDLAIRSGAGHIHVQAGSADTVRVVGRIKANNSWFAGKDVEQRVRDIERNPPVEQQGNVIQIGRFADEDQSRGLSIRYDVTVPSDTKLNARTGSGGVNIGDIKGPVDATTGSGGIVIGRIGGPVVVSAGSGGIQVEGAASLQARTGSGAIRASAVAGPTTARSGSGSIRIAQAGKGDVEVSASSGGITVTGVDGAARVSCSSGSVSIEGRPSGPWSIRSSSGGVTLGLPADAAFDLDARAGSGGIDSAHPVTVVGSLEKRTMRGKVRGGGPLVEVRTSSGSIRIR